MEHKLHFYYVYSATVINDTYAYYELYTQLNKNATLLNRM